MRPTLARPALPVALAATFLVALLAGCGSEPPDSASLPDARVEPPADASFDGGPEEQPDAGTPDSGPADAGSECSGAEDGTECAAGAGPGTCRAGSCRAYRLTRALCLIADFSDATLEQHTGPGLRSVEEVRAMLDAMERHWRWASLETHRVEWEIARVRLDQPLSAGSFTDWAAYRDEVVRKARESLDLEPYDADGDGILDAMWIVASGHDSPPAYLSGGASRHLGANLFVDAQSSQSVAAGAYGNFNHETGHCLGLPDLYGPFGTIGFLSLMHDSWAVPANGFSAFDRMKLGWFEPTPVAQTTRGIELAPAEEELAAVRIPTPRAAEYFLVEYRRRPQSGYGSTPVDHDGLTILHVFEPGTQQLDPPLLKLEAADGAIAPESFPQPSDFWSPENGAGSFTGRSYLSETGLFRIENLARTSRGLRFDVVLLPGSTAPGPNLLANGSFEDGAGPLPDGWQTGGWQQLEGSFAWDPAVAHDGARSARISNAVANDAEWEQQVDGLVPGQSYLLCGWLRGEGIVGYENASVGASVCAMGTWSHSPGGFGSFDWREECTAFRPETASLTVGCRLGYTASTASGTSWCDGMTLAPVGSAFR